MDTLDDMGRGIFEILSGILALALIGLLVNRAGNVTQIVNAVGQQYQQLLRQATMG